MLSVKSLFKETILSSLSHLTTTLDNHIQSSFSSSPSTFGSNLYTSQTNFLLEISTRKKSFDDLVDDLSCSSSRNDISDKMVYNTLFSHFLGMGILLLNEGQRVGGFDDEKGVNGIRRGIYKVYKRWKFFEEVNTSEKVRNRRNGNLGILKNLPKEVLIEILEKMDIETLILMLYSSYEVYLLFNDYSEQIVKNCLKNTIQNKEEVLKNFGDVGDDVWIDDRISMFHTTGKTYSTKILRSLCWLAEIGGLEEGIRSIIEDERLWEGVEVDDGEGDVEEYIYQGFMRIARPKKSENLPKDDIEIKPIEPKIVVEKLTKPQTPKEDIPDEVDPEIRAQETLLKKNITTVFKHLITTIAINIQMSKFKIMIENIPEEVIEILVWEVIQNIPPSELHLLTKKEETLELLERIEFWSAKLKFIRYFYEAGYQRLNFEIDRRRELARQTMEFGDISYWGF